MTKKEYYTDHKIYMVNALNLLIKDIKVNGIFEETSGWLIKYGKYNLEAVEYLKKYKIFSKEEFQILDKITEMVEYYENLIGSVDDTHESSCLNRLTEQDQTTLENLVVIFLSLQKDK